MQASNLILFSSLAILAARAQSHDDSPSSFGLPPATFTPRPTSKGSYPLPPCVVKCLTDALQSSDCKINDQACACTNPAYQNASKACIETRCLPEDQEKAARLQDHCSDISDDRIASSSTQPQTPTIINYAEETGRVVNVAFSVNELQGWRKVVIAALSLFLAV
ncbi:hypothetical protein Agabi119p4_4911 [Agaricus bisporus var. burnettii]|uniref:CFEM domain-containing protein n=1 Tax=Agaricus bisporus var. burnettii TaxID=192524 RepID=A0A8H7F471_AGABI|nr:hypothetical protein Agabi119p4_4911 [Agaricus bisporus var. burnettii]